MRLLLSPYGVRDFEEIADYIALDSPGHAAGMIRLLRARMTEIAAQPYLYQLRPELAADARVSAVGHYMILFRIRENAVRVERVVHGSRDLPPMVEGTEG